MRRHFAALRLLLVLRQSKTLLLETSTELELLSKSETFITGKHRDI